MQSTERWLPVPGWEGWYEVSDHGRVRSLDREVPHARYGVMRLRGRTLTPTANTNGRMQIALCREKRRGTRQVQVHRLVLEAFVGPCPTGMQACHWDDDPSNNHLSNLRWDTPSNNMHDRVRNGRHQMARKTHCKRGHPLEGANLRPETSKDGRRGCRACRFEQAQARQQGRPFDQSLADAQYTRIIELSAQGVDFAMSANKRKTHCSRGHALDAPNLVVGQLKYGKRSCRTCQKFQQSAHRRGVSLDHKAADAHYRELMG